jgi:hypothetical protein
MSGLDTSQLLTDEVSMNAEKFHAHSKPAKQEESDAAEAAPSDPAAPTVPDAQP